MAALRGVAMMAVLGLACGRVDFEVVSDTLQIWPAEVEVNPEQVYRFSVIGGQPPYACELVSGPGSISIDGEYRAPASPGGATVRCRDARGDVVSATVHVFSPSELAGVRLWLDASALAGQADGTLVERWPDRSGAGLDALQPDIFKRPSFASTGMNGRPAVQFRQPDTAMRTGDLTVGAFTIATVFRAGNTGIIYEHGLGNWLQTDRGDTISTSHGGSRTSYDLGERWGQDDVPRVAVHRFAGTHASHSLRVDGRDAALTLVTGASPGTAPWTAPLDLGSRGDGADWWLDGQIAELIVLEGSLTDDELQRLECYLGRRYSISVEGCELGLRVQPHGITVPAGASVEVSIAGGLGPFSLELVAGGATITPTEAGAQLSAFTSGTSVLRVADRVGHVEHVVIESASALPPAGLSLWLRASDLVATGHGDLASIAGWRDRSGNELLVRQPVGERQPRLASTGLNGAPAIECNGQVNDQGSFLVGDYLTLGQFTVSAVFRATNGGVVWGHGRNVWLQTTIASTISVLRPSQPRSSKDLALNWAVDDTPHVVTVVFDGTHAGHRLFVDGTERVLTSVSGDTGDPGTERVRAPLNVCGWVASWILAGYVAELVVYDRPLSDTERNLVETELRRLYAL